MKAFEIKLSQGAKPGKGGVLPGGKVTAEIARDPRHPGRASDSISPNRHRDIANMDELLDKVAWMRDLTGRPVGVKTAIGGWDFMNELCRHGAPPRPGVRARLPRDRRRRGRLGRGAAGARRPHGAVDRGGAAARGGLAHRVRT